MAQLWSRKFYNSKAWKDCREAYIQSVHGLCERCDSPTSGYIVHHKIVLTPQNINEPTITLNHEHLEYLCLICHNHVHGSEATAEGVTFDERGEVVPR
jgi:5-methylcytosine-specific restriction enzyme A